MYYAYVNLTRDGEEKEISPVYCGASADDAVEAVEESVEESSEES